MFDHVVMLAFLATTLAGASTGLGGLVAFAKPRGAGFLSGALGFSAGVMLYISLTEILGESTDLVASELGVSSRVPWVVLAGFACGLLVAGVLDFFVFGQLRPLVLQHSSGVGSRTRLYFRVRKSLRNGRKEPESRILNDRDLAQNDSIAFSREESASPTRERELLRSGRFLALAIGLHNFPEGLATFLAFLVDPVLGVAMALAIALHNIPEGMAVAIPIYGATGSRGKAFCYALVSGLAEPLGALIGYLLLEPYLTGTVFGFVFACIAGLMVYISLDEVLPSAHKFGSPSTVTFGVATGMMVMAVSLIMLQ